MDLIKAVIEECEEGAASRNYKARAVGVALAHGAEITDEIVGQARGEVGRPEVVQLQPGAEGIEGTALCVPSVRTLGVTEKCFPLRLPIETLGIDRQSHLGLELIHNDALSNLVDIGGHEVRNPGQPPSQAGLHGVLGAPAGL